MTGANGTWIHPRINKTLYRLIDVLADNHAGREYDKRQVVTFRNRCLNLRAWMHERPGYMVIGDYMATVRLWRAWKRAARGAFPSFCY